MGIGFGKEYDGDKKVNRIIIPDQQGTATTCTVTATDENQFVETSLHYDETIIGWFHTHPQNRSFLTKILTFWIKLECNRSFFVTFQNFLVRTGKFYYLIPVLIVK